MFLKQVEISMFLMRKITVTKDKYFKSNKSSRNQKWQRWASQQAEHGRNSSMQINWAVKRNNLKGIGKQRSALTQPTFLPTKCNVRETFFACFTLFCSSKYRSLVARCNFCSDELLLQKQVKENHLLSAGGVFSVVDLKHHLHH